MTNTHSIQTPYSSNMNKAFLSNST